MKRIMALLLCVIMIVSVAACGKKDGVRNSVNGNMKNYYEMNDGSWMCDDCSYEYRLEISGRMPNAAVDTTFVFLSNIPDISFEQAYKAAGISSNSEDYFKPEEAVLVEMK